MSKEQCKRTHTSASYTSHPHSTLLSPQPTALHHTINAHLLHTTASHYCTIIYCPPMVREMCEWYSVYDRLAPAKLARSSIRNRAKNASAYPSPSLTKWSCM